MCADSIDDGGISWLFPSEGHIDPSEGTRSTPLTTALCLFLIYLLVALQASLNRPSFHPLRAMDKPNTSGVDIRTVYKMLASCDGGEVEKLLKRMYFEMLGFQKEHAEYRYGIFTLNIGHTGKANVRSNAGRDDPPNFLEPEFDDKRQEVTFDAVHVHVKSLLPLLAEGKKEKSKKPLDALIENLNNLGKFQFRFDYYRGEMAGSRSYTLPLPEGENTTPSPCIMFTDDLHHTTICWKVVEVGGYKTLAIAHLNVKGYRYKHFHKLVKQHARLEVPNDSGKVQPMEINGCWGPADYFLEVLTFKGWKQRSTAGGSCVVVGVWDSNSRSWQLYVQVRGKNGEVKEAFALDLYNVSKARV